MDWYSSSHKHRIPISIPGGATAARDARITIPTKHDHFWGQVQDDHHDVAVTGPDGVTLKNFEFDSWTYASLAGVLDIEDVDARSGETALCWLYYGNPSSVASLETSFVYAAADTGYLDMGRPTGQRLLAIPDLAGITIPSRRVAKRTTDELYIYWDPTPLLAPRARSRATWRGLEGIAHASLSVTVGGAAQAAMIDATLTRFVEDPRRLGGVPWIKTIVKAGADNTDYTLTLNVRTTDSQIRTSVALLQVRNPDEA